MQSRTSPATAPMAMPIVFPLEMEGLFGVVVEGLLGSLVERAEGVWVFESVFVLVAEVAAVDGGVYAEQNARNHALIFVLSSWDGHSVSQRPFGEERSGVMRGDVQKHC